MCALSLYCMCAHSLCLQDCVTGDWQPFSNCTKECTECIGCTPGNMSRFREVHIPQRGSGDGCGALSEFRQCNRQFCYEAAPCVMSDWSPWGSCSMPCGGGFQNRTRRVIRESKLGHTCPPIEDTTPCNTEGCICGDGKMQGQETCDDGGSWPGDGCNEKCLLEPGFQCRRALEQNVTTKVWHELDKCELAHSGSCRHTRGPVKCVDARGAGGGASASALEQCSSWRNQGGGWKRKAESECPPTACSPFTLFELSLSSPRSGSKLQLGGISLYEGVMPLSGLVATTVGGADVSSDRHLTDLKGQTKWMTPHIAASVLIQTRVRAFSTNATRFHLSV